MKRTTALERHDVPAAATATVGAWTGRRRMRVLPPVGASIPSRAVARGLAACFNPEETIERLASALVESFGLQHWVFVSSGRAALSVALMALKEHWPGR